MTLEFNSAEHSNRRGNTLTGQWVLVLPHLAKRPWQGQQEDVAAVTLPAYDPDYYLCAGNTRVSGDVNPQYTGAYVFTNDHAALMLQVPIAPASEDPLFQMHEARGTSRVVCFSPDHSRTLPELSITALTCLVDVWSEQTADLGQEHAWVQVFENKGTLMGCSQPHPHGQIWAKDHLPNEAQAEDEHQRTFFQTARPSDASGHCAKGN
ncbi:MAG: galactose-1-phosphate uridylyltransferase [Limnohabitans sp.]